MKDYITICLRKFNDAILFFDMFAVIFTSTRYNILLYTLKNLLHISVNTNITKIEQF